MQKSVARMKYVLVMALLATVSACVVAPRYHEGYWDREHDRYWAGGVWHRCDEHREFCR
jgi:hypothetical protein